MVTVLSPLATCDLVSPREVVRLQTVKGTVTVSQYDDVHPKEVFGIKLIKGIVAYSNVSSLLAGRDCEAGNG